MLLTGLGSFILNTGPVKRTILLEVERMVSTSQTQVSYLSGENGREDRENKKDMQQKAGLSLPSVNKLRPIEKESIMKTLCYTRDNVNLNQFFFSFKFGHRWICVKALKYMKIYFVHFLHARFLNLLNILNNFKGLHVLVCGGFRNSYFTQKLTFFPM